MYCKNFRIKSHKGKKYFYCVKQKKEINFDNCRYCYDKEYKETKQLKFKTVKQSKKEKERFSVFYKDSTKCSICHSEKGHIDKHELFPGRNRSNSMKYGFIIYLCNSCHKKYTEDYSLINEWKIKAQKYFEKNIGTKEEFISIFGQNYIK